MPKLLPALLATLILPLPASRAIAQDASPAPAAAEPAAEPATGPQADFRVLFEKIGGKLKAGQKTEEALAGEIKEFDAIVAKYAGQKTDELAMVVFMKARLYLEVFENTGKAVVILKQIKADYPETEVGKNVDDIIASLEKQIAAETALAVGQVFPAIAEQDLDGKPLSLAAHKGKVVLVDFWATWCGPCVAELPNVLAAYEKYHGKGFEIVGISLDQEKDALTTFIADRKMTWQQYFDGQGWENKLSREFGISSIPATFLLDKDGRIVAKDLRSEQLDKELAKLLDE